MHTMPYRSDKPLLSEVAKLAAISGVANIASAVLNAVVDINNSTHNSRAPPTSTRPRAAMLGSPKTLPKPMLLVLICLATLIFQRNLLYSPHHKRLRNGPLAPPQPRSRTTSSKVFSPRTQRELNYLSKPFVTDFLSLSSVSNIFIVDQPPTRYAYCAVAQSAPEQHLALIHRLPHANATDNFTASSMGSEYVASVISDDDFAKYIIVRNPISRTLSSFLHVEAPKLPPHKHVKAFHEWVSRLFPKGRSFTAEELNRMNPHWIPQHIHCGMHKARVFKVFKYEYPQQVSRFLQPLLPQHVMQDWHPRNDNDLHVTEFVKFFNNTDVFDRVKHFCKRDIDMFDYHDQVSAMRQTVVDNLKTG